MCELIFLTIYDVQIVDGSEMYQSWPMYGQCGQCMVGEWPGVLLVSESICINKIQCISVTVYQCKCSSAILLAETAARSSGHHGG